MGLNKLCTAQLICAFVFAYAKSRFSHDAARMIFYIYIFAEENIVYFYVISRALYSHYKNDSFFFHLLVAFLTPANDSVFLKESSYMRQTRFGVKAKSL